MRRKERGRRRDCSFSFIWSAAKWPPYAFYLNSTQRTPIAAVKGEVCLTEEQHFVLQQHAASGPKWKRQARLIMCSTADPCAKIDLELISVSANMIAAEGGDALDEAVSWVFKCVSMRGGGRHVARAHRHVCPMDDRRVCSDIEADGNRRGVIVEEAVARRR